MMHYRRVRSFLTVTILAACCLGPAMGADLQQEAGIMFDEYRVPTIVAQNEHDAIYLQGFMHARDRMFQMDVQRRLFSGTLSELVGTAGLPQDVQLRTLGLRRAAERSLAVQTPESLAWLEAYAAGVNEFMVNDSMPLPIEYFALEITRDTIPAWTPLDSLTMVKGLAFGLSFGLEDIDNTLAVLSMRGVGDALGFNGLQLHSVDTWRVAPFDPTISIPGALATSSAPPAPAPQSMCFDEPGVPFDVAPECSATPNVPMEGEDEEPPSYMSDASFEALVRSYRESIADIPILARALENNKGEQGSNWWIADGSLTDAGVPMLANDPHLSLGTPSTFYEVHLAAGEFGINVAGVSFPGAPGLVLGCNDTICWGGTVNAIDVTDVYQEILFMNNPASPTTPTHTFFDGGFEPIEFIPQAFNANIFPNSVANTIAPIPVPADSGGVTLIVPRRNNGPIVDIRASAASPSGVIGLSVQYAGWSATQELETFRLFSRAASMQDFKDALQYFDVGSQNWSYADINGNIAYYTSGELPIREDLQFGFFPAGLQPPSLIRDGSHTNSHEWVPVLNPQPNQALDYEILPFAEMPQIENPPSGYVLNANNDPIGTTLDNVAWNQFRAGFNGLLYLSSGYAPGLRQGRLQQLWDDVVLAGGGTLSLADSIALQGNNQLLDAEVFTPFILEAWDNATAPGAHPALQALAADARVAEAVGRLAAWDFSTPTGIIQGFDPGDNPLAPVPPSQAEIDASVAATIYSVWRGQAIGRTIDTTLATLPVPLIEYTPGSSQAMTGLRKLLEDYPTTGGTGASLLNFFQVPGVVDAFDRRDIILLGELQESLDLLASATFAAAFDNSTSQEDYRWGKLHRIVFAHPLGGPFNIPPTGHPSNLEPDLPGFARAGGLGAVDASAHSARADGVNEFMFGSGPSRRVIATMTAEGPDVLEVIPGGESGTPGDPHSNDQLGLWLVNAYKPLPIDLADVNEITVDVETFECGDGIVGIGEECDDGGTHPGDGCDELCIAEPLPPDEDEDGDNEIFTADAPGAIGAGDGLLDLDFGTHRVVGPPQTTDRVSGKRGASRSVATRSVVAEDLQPSTTELFYGNTDRAAMDRLLAKVGVDTTKPTRLGQRRALLDRIAETDDLEQQLELSGKLAGIADTLSAEVLRIRLPALREQAEAEGRDDLVEAADRIQRRLERKPSR
ncbi:MAG: penicillin acylase family protein [bacterium]|nr:penicillin acylase family protein [bacterium]